MGYSISVVRGNHMKPFVTIISRTHNWRWITSPTGFLSWTCKRYGLDPGDCGEPEYLKNGIGFTYTGEIPDTIETDEKVILDNPDTNVWVYDTYTEDNLDDCYCPLPWST